VGVILNMVSRGRGGFEYGGYYYEQYRPAGERTLDQGLSGAPPAAPAGVLRRPASAPAPGDVTGVGPR
jgi:hypothetical protein